MNSLPLLGTLALLPAMLGPLDAQEGSLALALCGGGTLVVQLPGQPAPGFTVIDLDGMPDFNLQVYEIARKIPAGETLTYGDIAKRLGDVQLSRAVGQAMGQNPVPIVVPCHRVVAAGGKTGGFSALGGSQTKLKILAIERAKVGNAPDLFD